MNKRPLVSIITPSYNQGPYIEQTIRSVLEQSYPNIEYLVMDGSSADGTVQILRSYEKLGVSWLSSPDDGQSDAIQQGFELARGEILGWLNSDDLLLPDAVQKVVAAFEASPGAGLVYGDLLIVDERGQLLLEHRTGQLSAQRLLRLDQALSQPGSFYRAEVLRRVGGLDRSLRYAMDYDLFIKLLRASDGVYLEEPLAKFRLHPLSKSYLYGASARLREAFRVGRRHGAPLFCRLNARRLRSALAAGLKGLLGLPPLNVEKLRMTQTSRGSAGRHNPQEASRQ